MDGPGLPLILGKFARTIAKGAHNREVKLAASVGGDYAEFIARKHNAQSVKDIGVASGERRFLGNLDAGRIPLPAFSDETILNIKKLARQGAFNFTNPWAPQILTLQILKIGTLGICAFPFEITTVAAWRLKKSLEDALKNKGIEFVILCPYSNEYNGYITTFEEYQAQEYEGGHNVFGQWSLNALQQKFSELAHEFTKPAGERQTHPEVQPEYFSEEEIAKQTHYASRREKKLLRKEKKAIR
jgi:neutral ceramidase